MGWGKHRRSKEIQTTENFLRAVAPSGDASASAGVTMTWTTSCTGKMSPTGRGAYEYQRIPPLISHVPVKIRRTRVGLGVKSSFSPHKGARKSHLPREQIKFQTEELHSIRGELSQIKAQVDRLLENLEHMDQQRDQLPGGTPPTGGPGHIPSELQLFPLLKGRRTVKKPGVQAVRVPHAESLNSSRSPGARGPIPKQTALRTAQTQRRQFLKASRK
ncbi:uncharacterized protein LOC103673565 isoform X2 [Ursus maritimus]|uniref:Uncharacterized protein LOC103673565 isoform X2 n=1 Tax=Ursus maritimus TaxID=29073 RepID=A0A8M1GBV4_URSMA|nr:uncharacterized protein LOC103673565 isoform X2 [Ursus maritimus]